MADPNCQFDLEDVVIFNDQIRSILCTKQQVSARAERLAVSSGASAQKPEEKLAEVNAFTQKNLKQLESYPSPEQVIESVLLSGSRHTSDDIKEITERDKNALVSVHDILSRN